MRRLDIDQMETIAKKLFAKIHKRKHACNHNHEVHFLARDLQGWLPDGIRSLIDGSYRSRMLRRYYFTDDVVDQLYIPDRIYQHVLLKQIKPTFKYVLHPHCYHMRGPAGVKVATKQIRNAMNENKFNYFLRVDIKSYYASISRYKLIQDIKEVFDDPKVQVMLEDIVDTPIGTPNGYKNPSHGIALRGPLSQLFSAIYLKPLDDAFSEMQVAYARYQDDILILCKTKRQLNRYRRKMMNVLHERQLKLSRKKSKYGNIEDGFHFLGINYSRTRPLNKTKADQGVDHSVAVSDKKAAINKSNSSGQIRLTLHPRTLRKARENVRLMVADGVSHQYIRTYLDRWALWWVGVSDLDSHQKILQCFFDYCWDIQVAVVAIDVMRRCITSSSNDLAWMVLRQQRDA